MYTTLLFITYLTSAFCRPFPFPFLLKFKIGFPIEKLTVSTANNGRFYLSQGFHRLTYKSTHFRRTTLNVELCYVYHYWMTPVIWAVTMNSTFAYCSLLLHSNNGFGKFCVFECFLISVYFPSVPKGFYRKTEVICYSPKKTIIINFLFILVQCKTKMKNVLYLRNDLFYAR